VNLNSLALIPAEAGSKPNGLLRGMKLASNPIDVGLFKAQLAARSGVIAAKSSTSVDAMAAIKSRLDVLEKQIQGQLQSGASVSDVSTQLADSLATSVAAQLGISTADAKTRLQSAFQSALSPPGQTGPPGTTADRARTLAQRFATIANIATRVANGESGQLNRLVGNILDAKPAKETPAPATTPQPTPPAAAAGDSPSQGTSDQDVVSRVLTSFSQQAQLTVPQTPTLTAAAASDGKSVSIPSAQAIATGGNTLLGRILTRASQAADARQTVSSDSESEGSANVTSASTKSLQAAITSFLQSFEAAPATRATKTASTDTTSQDGTFTGLLAPSDQANTASAFAPSVAPFTIDAAPATAQSTSATPLHPAADPSAIVEQLVQGVFTRNLSDSSEIRLKLMPENLGDLTVKLSVSQAGTVSAHVIAQSVDVRDALIAGQSQLSKALADAGLKLDSFSVDVNSGFFAQGQGQSQQRSSTGRRAFFEGSDADESGDDSSINAVPSFGPPLLAHQNFGALNYLV